MPASRPFSCGWSSSRVNAAIVRSRSRYSSMSRLMNFALPCRTLRAASSYSGVSLPTTSSTASSNDHIDSWLTTLDTLIET